MENTNRSARGYLAKYRQELSLILQNRLLDESTLIRFTRDRGIAISGVVTGDPSLFLELGWLESDEPAGARKHLFHPFRIYALYRIIKACTLNVGASSSVNREHFPPFLLKVADRLPSLESIGEGAALANEVVDLAILLEPLYWPLIILRTTVSGLSDVEEHERLVEDHRTKVGRFLRRLSADEWQKRHERLRLDAGELDDNGDVYMLLRLSPWLKRERLKSRIAGALWIRHMAEVLRRGFEEFHSVRWLEEDQSFGRWFTGARERIYGADRPLDDPLAARPRVAFEFGLHTGSTIRWYLEGETEFYATLAVLPRAAAGGIELVNLKGALSGRRNAALRLADALQQDLHARRFSFISFDMDVPANVRTIQTQVKTGKVVGYVNANEPDFEFANFSLGELVEIAARLDESYGVSADELRGGDWTGVSNGREFEERYCNLSARHPRGLKGEEWGAALGEFAIENPCFKETDENRPFVSAVDAVIIARHIRYEDHRDHYYIDPESFELVERSEASG